MAHSTLKYIICFVFFYIASNTNAFAELNSKNQLVRGGIVYHKFCSRCHGKKLEGQPNWRVRKADGKLPAPPLDGSGHTWHHSDELLMGIIKKGIVPPYGPENYPSDMPAWEGTLTDSDIMAVLVYIKSKWPKEAREIQANINARSKKPFSQ